MPTVKISGTIQYMIYCEFENLIKQPEKGQLRLTRIKEQETNMTTL